MPHLRSPGIGPFSDKRDSQDLVTMVAGDSPGILIRILDILFIDPKKLFTFWAFFNQFRHSAVLFSAGISCLFSVIQMGFNSLAHDYLFRSKKF